MKKRQYKKNLKKTDTSDIQIHILGKVYTGATLWDIYQVINRDKTVPVLAAAVNKGCVEITSAFPGSLDGWTP